MTAGPVQLAETAAKGHLSRTGLHQGVNLMRKLLLAVMLAAPLMASACNTIAGFGKDVGAVGDAVSDTAEKTK